MIIFPLCNYIVCKSVLLSAAERQSSVYSFTSLTMLMKKTSITEKHLFFLCNFEMNVVFVSHRFFAVLLIDCAGHVTQDEPSQKSFFFCQITTCVVKSYFISDCFIFNCSLHLCPCSCPICQVHRVLAQWAQSLPCLS